MKKKSIELLISNLLSTFFFITLATYLAFVVKMLLEKEQMGENFSDMLLLGHLPALFMIVGAIAVFVSLFIGWTAFAMNKVCLMKADAIALSVGFGLMLFGTVAAFIDNPPYAFVSFLFAAFFFPSATLAWVSFLRRR